MSIGYRQIELIIALVLVSMFLGAIFLTKKAVKKSFKKLNATEFDKIKFLKVRISIFYTVSVIFLIMGKSLEFLVRYIDISTSTLDLLTYIFAGLAIIFYIVAFVLLVKWCNIRAKGRGLWLWSFFFGAISIIPNVYLLVKLSKNSKNSIEI